MVTKHLAIMLTDIKGFTSRTATQSRADMLDLLKRHKELVLPVIEKFHGRLVKTIGDAFLVVFESPTDAVLCGSGIQEVLKSHNAGSTPESRIDIRIAINSGEVAVEEDGDIYGDAVNITSRLESIAEAGQVFFTEAVYLAMNKKEVPSSEIGYRQFKGIPEKIKVYRVLTETPVGTQPIEVVPQTPAEKAADPVPAEASQAGADFLRRLASLLVDAAILAVFFNMSGLSSERIHARYKPDNKSEEQGSENVDIKSVKFSKDGMRIVGQGGEVISINKEGVKVDDKGGTVKVPRRSSISIEEGNYERSRFPFKLLLCALYCGIFMWRFSATPGMRILKLKVVDFASGGPAATDKIFLRAFFSLVSFGAALVGYIWALWEKDHRTWHDLIAGTRIVKI